MSDCPECHGIGKIYLFQGNGQEIIPCPSCATTVQSLSSQVRPNSEAAPWVVERIKLLEADHAAALAERDRRIAELEAEREHLSKRLDSLGSLHNLDVAEHFAAKDRIAVLEADALREIAERDARIAELESEAAAGRDALAALEGLKELGPDVCLHYTGKDYLVWCKYYRGPYYAGTTANAAVTAAKAAREGQA